MTRDEMAQLTMIMKAYWGNMEVPSVGVAEIWFEDLQHVDFEIARTAIRGLSRDGREFAPPIGVILAEVDKLTDTCPDWPSVQAEMRRKFDCFHPVLGSESEWSHPVAFWTACAIGVDEFQESDPSDSYTQHRFKEIYKDKVERHKTIERELALETQRQGRLNEHS